MERITISLEKEIAEKIIELQQETTKKAGKSWSISKTINILVLGGILFHDKLYLADWNVVKDFADGKRIDVSEKNLAGYLTNLQAIDQVF